jgi:hypothetical protein
MCRQAGLGRIKWRSGQKRPLRRRGFLRLQPGHEYAAFQVSALHPDTGLHRMRIATGPRSGGVEPPAGGCPRPLSRSAGLREPKIVPRARPRQRRRPRSKASCIQVLSPAPNATLRTVARIPATSHPRGRRCESRRSGSLRGSGRWRRRVRSFPRRARSPHRPRGSKRADRHSPSGPRLALCVRGHGPARNDACRRHRARRGPAHRHPLDPRHRERGRSEVDRVGHGRPVAAADTSRRAPQPDERALGSTRAAAHRWLLTCQYCGFWRSGQG